MNCYGLYPPINLLNAITIFKHDAQDFDLSSSSSSKDVEFSQVFCSLIALYEEDFGFSIENVHVNLTQINDVTKLAIFQRVSLQLARHGTNDVNNNQIYMEKFALVVKPNFTLTKVDHDLLSSVAAVPKKLYLKNPSSLPIFKTFEIPL